MLVQKLYVFSHVTKFCSGRYVLLLLQIDKYDSVLID